MKTLSIFIENIDELDNSLKLIKENYSFAIVFASVAVDFSDLINIFNNNKITLIGASSCGNFMYEPGEEAEIGEDTISIMLFDLPENSFKLGLLTLNDTEENLANEIVKDVNNTFKNAGLILMISGLKMNCQTIVESIKNQVGKEMQIFGGLAGDDNQFIETFVFNNEKSITNSVAYLILDLDKIEMKGIATSGWVSIGSKMFITKAKGNVIYEIDNKPALDVYTEYLGINEEDLPGIGVEYPILIIKPERNIIRAVLGIDKVERWVSLAGSIEEGTAVTFSSSPGFEVIEQTNKEIDTFYDETKDIDALLIYSCMARHRALGPMITDEIEHIGEKYNKSFIGFFTYGEIGNGKFLPCELHNQTICLVTLKEK